MTTGIVTFGGVSVIWLSNPYGDGGKEEVIIRKGARRQKGFDRGCGREEFIGLKSVTYIANAHDKKKG